ncbi:hypothetical protein BDB01DRAFT_837201 [Pilobolus umbonatus]|nr:hypothetical protein BDB01DRAFT_837201 [Pilobolus umbonatus]
MPAQKRQRNNNKKYTNINNTNTEKGDYHLIHYIIDVPLTLLLMIDEEIRRLKQLLGEVSAERDELKKENWDLKSKNTLLKKEMASAKLSIIARDDKVVFAQKKVAEVEEEKEALLAKNHKCKSYINKLKAEVEVYVELGDCAREEVQRREERVKHYHSKFKSARMDARKLQDIIKDKDERIAHLMDTVNPSKALMLILGDEVERLNKEKEETTKYHDYLWELTGTGLDNRYCPVNGGDALIDPAFNNY